MILRDNRKKNMTKEIKDTTMQKYILKSFDRKNKIKLKRKIRKEIIKEKKTLKNVQENQTLSL